MTKRRDGDASPWGRRELLRILGAGAAIASVPEIVRPDDAKIPSAAAAHAIGGDESERQADVVVVGAGFSGLTAARAVAKAGKKVVVLEARNRVGGRVKAGSIAGRKVDVGRMGGCVANAGFGTD